MHLSLKACLDSDSMAIEPWGIFIEKYGMPQCMFAWISFLVLCRMSPETRHALRKHANQVCESGRIAVRQIRQKAMSEVKRKGSAIGEDERIILEQSVDELTKRFVAEIDEGSKVKEKELQD